MNEKIKEMQQWLWDHKFAPKNVSYEKFVDGYDGRMTQAALRKAKKNHWEFKDDKPTFTMTWQKPSEKPKPKPENILLQRLESGITATKKSVKEQHKKQQEEAKKYGSSMEGNARRLTKQLQEDLVSKQYDIGIYGADGRMGNDTKRALAQAEKDGWQVVNNRLVKKSQQTEKPQSTTIGLPEVTGVPGKEGRVMNSFSGLKEIISNYKPTGYKHPGAVLLDAKIRGSLDLPEITYEFPDTHKKVLSDKNQFIFDNWNDAIQYNKIIATKLLNNNQKALEEATKNKDTKEIERLTQEIEDNKKSISNIQDTFNKLSKAGGLQKYLLAHPNEKIIIGGNERFYKDKNMHRFPKGTDPKYAYAFQNNVDLGYALNTPLGQTEYAYGNDVHSYVYDPQRKEIITAVSDSYNFNPVGTENDTTIGKLRQVAGKDEDYGKVSFRSELAPISLDPTKKNYITDSKDFGEASPASPLENIAVKIGLASQDKDYREKLIKDKIERLSGIPRNIPGIKLLFKQ